MENTCLSLTKEKQNLILKYVPENKTLENLSGLFSAFADRTRLKIISALAINEMCVSDISMLLQINQTTASHQLRLLKNLGVVESSRNGKIIFYNISKSYINEILLSGVECLYS